MSRRVTFPLCIKKENENLGGTRLTVIVDTRAQILPLYQKPPEEDTLLWGHWYTVP